MLEKTVHNLDYIALGKLCGVGAGLAFRDGSVEFTEMFDPVGVEVACLLIFESHFYSGEQVRTILGEE